jgi:TPR repeat protein
MAQVCDAYLRKDYKAALAGLLPLANGGNADAQIAIGWLYDNGLGMPHEDDAQAAKWYELAANQDDDRAQQFLGTMYATGDGVDKDLKAAEHWFRLAADQDNPGGQFGLGVMYRDGAGVSRDPVEAYKWLGLAAQSPEATPEAAVDQLALSRSMTQEQIAAGDAAIAAWNPERHVEPRQICSTSE